MKVRFEFTLDDLVDASERTVIRSRAVRGWRWQDMAGSALLAGVLAYVIRPESGAARLGWALVAAVIAGTLYPLVAARSRKARLLKYFRERFGGDGPYTCEVELTPAGVVTVQSGVRTVREWSNIERVEDTQDAIEFVTRGSGTVVVRNRAFSSKDEWRQFLEMARKYAGNGGAGNAS